MTDRLTVTHSTTTPTMPEPGVHPRASWCSGLEFQAAVVHGDGRGRHLGFPTANLLVASGVTLPRDGVYVALATVPNWVGTLSTSRRAALSVGDNPTFGAAGPQVEAHLLDFEGDLYGRTVRIRVMDYLRQMRAFDGVDALVEAIDADIGAVRRWRW